MRSNLPQRLPPPGIGIPGVNTYDVNIDYVLPNQPVSRMSAVGRESRFVGDFVEPHLRRDNAGSDPGAFLPKVQKDGSHSTMAASVQERVGQGEGWYWISDTLRNVFSFLFAEEPGDNIVY